MTFEGLSAIGISTLVAFFWTYHLWRTWQTWRTYRDARSFRNFLIALMVEMGAVTLLLGSFGIHAAPAVLDVARVAGNMTRGALLVVGILAFWLWHRPVPRERDDLDPRVPR